MRTIHFMTGLLLAGTFIAGCTRENPYIPPAPYPVGGKGGKATLRVTPRHHLRNLDTCVVYIYYNSKQMRSSFDDTAYVKYIDGRSMVIFDSLKRGDYFLYAKGLNYDIEDSNKTVTGGAYFTVIDSVDRTYDLYLDVLDHENK